MARARKLHLAHRIALGLIPSFAIGACGAPRSSSPSAPHDAPYVEGGHLHDADGRVLLLRGANVANAHKREPYFGFHGPDDFGRLRRDLGFNSIRLLITWAAIEPTKGRYDDAYLDAVRQRLDWAMGAGLRVILDMHEDLYGEGFGGDGAPRWTCDEARYAAFKPATPWYLGNLDANVIACDDAFWNDAELQAHFLGAWKAVAARLHDHPAVIGFDVLNEPYWGSRSMLGYEADLLQPFYESVVPAVRAVAPAWVAFLEPGASRNLGVPTKLEPFPFANVVYAPHAYDTDAESGKPFDADHAARFTATLGALRREADALGAALWIGEYGGNADDPSITPYMTAAHDGLDAALASSAYWSYDRGGGYGMVKDDGAEKTALWDAIVRPYAELVAGTPSRAAFDGAARAFTFAWEASGDGVTEIVAPKRVYPSGVVAECTACSADVQGERVLLRAASGAHAVAVLRPAPPR
jgi:endoglycosylceramidase